MSEHTPGPWRADHDFEIVSDAGLADPYIADVFSRDGGYTDERQRERTANANLIAAAPDLLAAAENALYVMENTPAIYSLSQSAQDKLRQAINKAGGEA